MCIVLMGVFSEMGREVMAPDFFIDHMLVVASGTDSDEEKQQKLKEEYERIERLKQELEQQKQDLQLRDTIPGAILRAFARAGGRTRESRVSHRLTILLPSDVICNQFFSSN